MKMKNSKTMAIGVVATSLLMVFSTLGITYSTAASTSTRAASNELIVATLQDPGTMDIVKQNQTALVLWVPGNVYETLLVNHKNGTQTGGVAQSWTVSKNQLVYTFKIRDEKFSDGTPVTVNDVVYSLNTFKNGPIGSYHGPFATVKSIAATDAHTVKITLSSTSRSFIKGMGGMSGSVLEKANEAQRATNPIGSGPYVLKEYVPNDHLTFIPNTNYWGPVPKMKQVTVKIMTDGNAILAALKAGEVDAFPVITIDLWERVSKGGYDKTFKAVHFPQAGEMLYTLFNQNVAPYNNAKVRHALAKMIDRKAFIAAYGAPDGTADPTCGYGLQNTSWFTVESPKTCVDAYNPAQGAKELKAAGFNKFPLDYVSLTDVPDLSLPADLQIGQFTAAGATIKRKAISLAEYSKTIFAGRPQQFGVSIMSDPALFAGNFSCPDPTKAAWHTYCSKRITELLVKADGAKTQKGADTYYKAANKVLEKDAYIVPILAKAGLGLWNPGVKGWQEPAIFVDQDFANLSW
jgi:peptide/nickel transport system substrate-binding protein